MTRTFLIFDVGYGLGTSKSGGTTRLIEVMRRLPADEYSPHFVTSAGGGDVYASEDFYPETTILASSLFFRVEKYKFQRLVSNAVSLLHSLVKLPSLPKPDIVYSSSDYLFDVIPAVLTKIFRSGRYFAFVHHLCVSPADRRGHILINSISYASQRLSFHLIRRYADKVFVYDTPEGDQIAQFFHGSKVTVHKVFNGVNLPFLASFRTTTIHWDACFAGGLRATKGIFDVIRVWRLVADRLPGAQLLIMGSGSPQTVSQLRAYIEHHGLSGNVTLFGHAKAPELIQNMKNSRVFISTSHEEGWGIALCEAIACGLKAHAYSLPAFQRFAEFIHKVDKFDEVSLAKNIIASLSDPVTGTQGDTVNKTRLKAFEEMVSWDRIAAREVEEFGR